MAHDSFSVSDVIPAPPERIYSAWLDAAAHSAFTGEEATFEPFVGGRHTAFGGYSEGTNLELLPGRRIVQSWRAKDFPDGSPDSRLEVTLEETVGGTVVTILHSELPSGQSERYRDGWVKFYLEPLKTFFSSDADEDDEDDEDDDEEAASSVSESESVLAADDDEDDEDDEDLATVESPAPMEVVPAAKAARPRPAAARKPAKAAAARKPAKPAVKASGRSAKKVAKKTMKATKATKPTTKATTKATTMTSAARRAAAPKGKKAAPKARGKAKPKKAVAKKKPAKKRK